MEKIVIELTIEVDPTVLANFGYSQAEFAADMEEALRKKAEEFAGNAGKKIESERFESDMKGEKMSETSYSVVRTSSFSEGSEVYASGLSRWVAEELATSYNNVDSGGYIYGIELETE